MSQDPQQPFLKSGGYAKEQDTFSDLQNVLKNFATKKLRPSRTSPPIANDVGELEWVIDKATLKLWIKINGALKSVTFS